MKLVDDVNSATTKLIAGIKSNMSSANRNASGKTSNSIRSEFTQSATGYKVTVYGSGVLFILEDGRKPTKNASSNRTWENNLRNWMRIRGIEQSAFYPIWRKINEEGFKGTDGLVSNPVNQFKKDIASAVKRDSLNKARELSKQFKNLESASISN